LSHSASSRAKYWAEHWPFIFFPFKDFHNSHRTTIASPKTIQVCPQPWPFLLVNLYS
jgi:hypothetical protein